MRKLLEKLCLALFPLALLFLFFFIYEPYDYWNVKGWSMYMAKPISTLRELKLRDGAELLLLGDSHMANLNTGLVEEASGQSAVMLGFGGGTFPEAVEELRYVLEDLGETPERVVVGMSFYAANSNHSADRIGTAIEMTEDPISFIGNASYWYDALTWFRKSLGDQLADLTGNERFRIVMEDPSALDQNLAPVSTEYQNDYRVDMTAYASIIYTQVQDYGDMELTLKLLEQVVDLCEQRGIELEFILWPSNRTIWDKVIRPLGLSDEIDIYKDYLKSRVKVYDMEWESAFAGRDELFMDGFHLTLEGKLMVIDAVFGGEEVSWCTVTTPEQYNSSK